MKGLQLLIWMTQLGLSTALPLGIFVMLGVWLHKSHGWGQWAIWAGVIFGAYLSIQGLIDSLRTMEKHAKKNLDTEVDPPLSFNDHD